MAGKPKKKTAKKRGRGQPPYERNEAHLKTLTRLILIGAPQEKMAAMLGISEKTLRKHYKPELETTKLDRLANVGASLYNLAIGGNVAAAIFYLKTQGGWSEKTAQPVREDLNIEFEETEKGARLAGVSVDEDD